MGVSGQRHALAALYPWGKDPSTHWIGGWAGLRTSLDAGARRKILCPCRGLNPNHPARSQTLYCLSYCGSFVPGTPDEFKEKSGTPCKRNSENTQPAFLLLIEKKAHSTAWLY
jgi:hypothetical protein